MFITARAKIQFFYLLSERGFRGKLLANHDEKKLDLRVRSCFLPRHMFCLDGTDQILGRAG